MMGKRGTNIASMDDDGESPRGSANAGAFPDFHHKMSKKIAQLTKVIHHLNTKNDDHEFQLQSLVDTYESEIEEILRDTSKKINYFKNLIEQKRNDGKLEEAIRNLTAQHNLEKQKALEEFEHFKKQAKVRELNITQTAEERIQKLTNELNMTKKEFQAQMEKFAQLSKQFELEQNRNRERLKDSHAQEMEELVIKYNKKYNDMLNQMMNENDETERKLKQEYEKRLEQIRKEEALKIAALLEEEERKRRDSLEQQRRELVGLQSQTSGQLQDLQREIQRLKDIETMLNSRLTKQMIELEKKEHEYDQMSTEVQKTRVENVELRRQINGAETLVNELKMEIAALQSKLMENEQAMNAKLTEQSILLEKNTELQKQIEERDHTIVELRAQLDGLSGEASSDKGFIAQLQMQVHEAKMSVERLTLSERELKRQIDALAEERDKRIMDLTQKHQSELVALRQKHDKEIAELNQLREANDSSMQQAIKTLKEQHAAQIAKMQEESSLQRKELLEKHSMEVRQLEEKYRKLLDEYDRARSDLQMLDQNSQKGQSELKSQLLNLQREKAQQLDALREEMRDKVNRLTNDYEDKVRAVEQRLQASESSNSSLQLQVSSLKSQIQNLEHDVAQKRKQLEDLEYKIMSLTQKANQDLINAGVSKDEALAKLKRELNEKWEDSMRDSRMRMERDFEAQRSELIQSLSSKAEIEKNELEYAFNNRISALENDIHSLKELIRMQEMEIIDGKQKLVSAKNQWRETEQRMTEEYKKQMMESNSSLITDYEDRIKKLIAQNDQLHKSKDQAFSEEKELLLKNFEKDKKLLQEHHSAQTEKLKVELENQRVRDVQSKEEEKNKEHEERVRVLSEKHRAQTLKMEQDTNQIKMELMQEIAKANGIVRERDEQLTSLKSHRDKIQSDLNQSLEEYRLKCEEIVEQRKELLEESKRKQKAMAKDHKAQINQIIEEHLSETQLLNEQFEQNQARIQETCVQLQKRIEEWEMKYRNRDPRPEDVERIRLLERDLVEKESMLQKAISDMKYFKLELKNREDTYTKMFGRQQTVGFINPLAAKTSATNIKGLSTTTSGRLPPL